MHDLGRILQVSRLALALAMVLVTAMASACGSGPMVPCSVVVTAIGSVPSGPVAGLHYSAGAGSAQVVTGTSTPMGFNLMDESSKAECDALPAGEVCLLYLGDTNYDSTTQGIITSTATDAKVWGYYILDEPADSLVAVLKDYVDFIHANAPAKYSFFVMENDNTPTSPSYYMTPTNTDMTTALDLVGLDPYPVRAQFTGGIDLAVINAGVSEALTVGWSTAQLVPVYQAFGGPPASEYASWTLPTAAQGTEILDTWAPLTPTPVFDYAYAWSQQAGDYPLGGAAGEPANIAAQTIQLQIVYANHNSVIGVTPSSNLATAIASASTGATISFGAGTYNIGNITLPSNIILSGNGVVVNFSGSSGAMFTANGSNVTIEGFSFTGTGYTNIGDEDGVIESTAGNNIHIQSNTFNGQTTGTDLYCWNTTNIYFQGNTVGANQYEPISCHLTSGNMSGLFVTDNTFAGFSRWLLEAQNNTSGNSGSYSNVHIDRNVITMPASGPTGALSVVTATNTGACNTVDGNTITVSPATSNSTVGIEISGADTTITGNTMDYVGWPMEISNTGSTTGIFGNYYNNYYHYVFAPDGGFMAADAPWIGTNYFNGSPYTGDDDLGHLTYGTQPPTCSPSAVY
jgi:hypothetical protein